MTSTQCWSITPVNIFDRWKRAEELPLGHTERVKARALIDQEYDRCWTVERKISARLIKRTLTPSEAAKVCGIITSAIGSVRVRRLVLDSPAVHPKAEAHWCRREIHFKSSFIATLTLLHELAHHLHRTDPKPGDRMSHGQSYCDMLELVYEIARTYIPMMFKK